jgi:hypothetical protein
MGAGKPPANARTGFAAWQPIGGLSAMASKRWLQLTTSAGDGWRGPSSDLWPRCSGGARGGGRLHEHVHVGHIDRRCCGRRDPGHRRPPTQALGREQRGRVGVPPQGVARRGTDPCGTAVSNLRTRGIGGADRPGLPDAFRPDRAGGVQDTLDQSPYVVGRDPVVGAAVGDAAPRPSGGAVRIRGGAAPVQRSIVRGAPGRTDDRGCCR